MSADQKVLCVESWLMEDTARAVLSLRPPGSRVPGSFFTAEEMSLARLAIISRSGETRGPIFVPRSVCETDQSFRQLITYSIVEYPGGMVLTYLRGEAGAEGRLHRLQSVGFGGHIEPDDVKGTVWPETFSRAADREIDEEIVFARDAERTDQVFASELEWKYEGLICVLDSDNLVDMVHCGIVFRYLVDDRFSYFMAEESQKNATLCSMDELRQLRAEDRFESWSKILVDWMDQQY